MSSTNGATMEVVRKAPEKSPKNAAFFKVQDEDDGKVLKWRFLAKGPALEAILSVFGATAKQGEKQVTFVVEDAEGLELGEVVRHLFARAHAVGLTKWDIVALIAEREAAAEKK